MTSVAIRPAASSDLPAIIEVEHRADAQFASVGLRVVLDAPQANVEDHAPAQVAGRLFVAVTDVGRVVGFARVDLVDGAPHIEQVSVHPEAAGRRVGARLMAACEQWAVAHGYDRATLCTYRDVPWNGPYYQRLGWTVLPDAELGAELRALRQHERDLGLEVQPRCAMAKGLTEMRSSSPAASSSPRCRG